MRISSQNIPTSNAVNPALRTVPTSVPGTDAVNPLVEEKNSPPIRSCRTNGCALVEHRIPEVVAVPPGEQFGVGAPKPRGDPLVVPVGVCSGGIRADSGPRRLAQRLGMDGSRRKGRPWRTRSESLSNVCREVRKGIRSGPGRSSSRQVAGTNKRESSVERAILIH